MINLKIYIICFLASLLLVSCKSTSSQVKSAIKESTLVWADEFETDGLPDPENWSYDVGDGCPRVCGWGNNELQYYTDSNLKNARVENGNLVIEAHKESNGGKSYTSARLVTKGKQDWTYGTFEIRAKLPKGRGTWPAIWMLPTESKYGGWPRSGEIDIMEHVGYNPDSIFGTPHTLAYHHSIGTHKSGGIMDKASEVGFHIYKIVWDTEAIRWYMDDELYHTFINEHKTSAEWPFDQPFHLILNIAVGGNWGGTMGVDDTIWPQQALIDYVRVYK